MLGIVLDYFVPYSLMSGLSIEPQCSLVSLILLSCLFWGLLLLELLTSHYVHLTSVWVLWVLV